MRLLDQTAFIQLQSVVADADSDSPDNLEDPDEIRAWARRNPQRAGDWLAGVLLDESWSLGPFAFVKKACDNRADS